LSRSENWWNQMKPCEGRVRSQSCPFERVVKCSSEGLLEISAKCSDERVLCSPLHLKLRLKRLIHIWRKTCQNAIAAESPRIRSTFRFCISSLPTGLGGHGSFLFPWLLSLIGRSMRTLTLEDRVRNLFDTWNRLSLSNHLANLCKRGACRCIVRHR